MRFDPPDQVRSELRGRIVLVHFSDVANAHALKHCSKTGGEAVAIGNSRFDPLFHVRWARTIHWKKAFVPKHIVAAIGFHAGGEKVTVASARYDRVVGVSVRADSFLARSAKASSHSSRMGAQHNAVMEKI